MNSEVKVHQLVKVEVVKANHLAIVCLHVDIVRITRDNATISERLALA